MNESNKQNAILSVQEDGSTILARIAWDLGVPFDPARIEWRPGATTRAKDKCIPLAYIDARTVMGRLDDVLGPFGWETRSDDPHVCQLTITLPDGRCVTRTNRAGDTQVEAEKGAYSTAFKRAAADFGVGRYLYHLPNQWVPYDETKRRIVTYPELPKWATPDGYAQLRPRP